MVTGLKPYPEYRDSGIAWFSSAPAHWTFIRVGRLFREVNDTGHPEIELLSIDRYRGIIRQTETGRKTRASQDRSIYKRIRPGELGYNVLNAFMGSIGISSLDGILSPAYAVGRPVKPLHPRYYHYLFRMQTYTAEFNRNSYGIMYERNRLYYERFKTILAPFPPLEEQRAIADFLDYDAALVARFIRSKRRQIELLQEQKRATVDRMVNAGLNGFGRFHEDPPGWVRQRLKYLVRNVNDQIGAMEPGEIYIALENVESWTGRVRLPDGPVLFDSQVKRFVEGDILFGKLRPYLAKVTRPGQAGVCVGEFLVLRRESEDVLPEFLEQKLRSATLISTVNSSTIGAKMPRANWDFIGSLPVSFPRSHDEQRTILQTIACQTSNLELAISGLQRQIDLIREYRTRLIADVVTGKLDARSAPIEACESTVEDIEVESADEELSETTDSAEEVAVGDE